MSIEEDIKMLKEINTGDDIEFKQAIENILADREFYKEWYAFYKDEQGKINKKIREILNLDECIETLDGLNRIQELLEKKV